MVDEPICLDYLCFFVFTFISPQRRKENVLSLPGRGLSCCCRWASRGSAAELGKLTAAAQAFSGRPAIFLTRVDPPASEGSLSLGLVAAVGGKAHVGSPHAHTFEL